MHKRFTSLSFIIGLFFILIAIVLLTGYFISALLKENINLYAGVAFIAFGVFMVAITPEEKETE